MTNDQSWTYPHDRANPQWVTNADGETKKLVFTDEDGNPIPACPECAGIHLYGLTFEHAPRCALYEADASRAAADHELGRGVRPATVTEEALAAALGTVATDGQQLMITFAHGGIHHRVASIEEEETK